MRSLPPLPDALRRGLQRPVRGLLVVALSALAACGGKDSGGTTIPVDNGPTGPAPVASVTITRGDSLILVVGTVDSLQAEVKDTDGKVVQKSVSWNSSNPNVVSVDGSGGLTPAGIGNARVSATVDGVTGAIAVSVEEYRVAEDVVIADEQKVKVVSDTSTLAATGELRLQTSDGAAAIGEGTVINAIVQNEPILRMVESTTVNGNEVVAQTRPATIADAVDAGTIGYVQALGSNAASTAPLRALSDLARAGTIIESCVGDAQSAIQQNVAQMVASNSPFADAVRASYSPVAIPLRQNLAPDVQVNADGSYSPAASQGVWFFEIPIPNNKGIDIKFRMEVSNARAAFTPVVCFMGQLNKDVSTVEEVAELAVEAVDKLLTQGKLPKVRVSQLRFQVSADVSFDANVKTSITAEKSFSAGDIDFGKLGGKLDRVKSLACPWFPTVTVPVGPIVLAFQPVFCLNLVAEVYAAVQASMEQSVHLNSQVNLGAWYAKWDGKGTKRYFKPISYSDNTLNASEPIVDLSGQVGARLGLKPEVGLYLYGVAGPYFNVEGGVDASAQASLQAGWSVGLQGYINANAGLKLKIPVIEETLADIGYTFPLWTSDVYGWSGQFTQPLALTVSPSAEQTRDWGGSVTYTVSATSNGIGVSGVQIPVSNGLTGGHTSVTTGANGTATFTADVGSTTANGSYDLTFGPATKSGYETSGSQKRTIVVQHLETLRIGTCVTTVDKPNNCYSLALDPGGTYNVFLGADIPAGGQAVCGAVIPLQDPFTGKTTTIAVPTDANPCLAHYPFTVPADAAPGQYTFVLGPATAAGYNTSTVTELVVTVKGTPGSVSGNVTVNGAGVGGVSVTLRRASTNSSSVTKSADDGTYSFGNLTADSYTVSVEAPLYTFSQPTRTLTVGNAENVTLDFSGSSAGGGGSTATISGSVTAGGVGLGGVMVNISGPTGAASTTTAADGTFGFGGLTTGTYTVSISYDTGLYSFSPSAMTVSTTIGAVATADFTGTSLGDNVASVRITPSSATLAPGGTVQLTATPLTSGGTEVAGRPVRWTSSNTNVVAVDGNGLISGVGGGTATVTATVDGQSGNALVTVTPVSTPFLGLSMSRVDFSAQPGGVSPAPQLVNVTNGGSGTLSGITVSVAYGAGQTGDWLTAALSGTTAPTTLSLTPSSGGLAAGTYNATVTVTAGGASNSPVMLPVTLVVEAVTVPGPSVVSWNVTEGQTEVGIDASIAATFSAAMDPATLNSSSFTLVGPAGAVDGTVSWDAETKTATFTPAAPLTEFESHYQATVTTGAVGESGQPLSAPASRAFTTLFTDPTYFYKIENQSVGSGLNLDTFSGSYGCHMSDAAVNYSGHFWYLFRAKDGNWVFRNWFGGDTRYLEGGDGTNPCYLTAGPWYPDFNNGQWAIQPLTGASAGYYRFVSLGAPTTSLDVPSTAGTPLARLQPTAEGSQSQAWKFIRAFKR